jgi:hypothetical protein
VKVCAHCALRGWALLRQTKLGGLHTPVPWTLTLVRTLRCPFLLDEVQPSAMVFPHLFCRNDFPTKLSELNKLMLDRLQPLVPPSVRDLSICPIQAVTPELLI